MARSLIYTVSTVENPTARGIGTGDQMGNSIAREVGSSTVAANNW
jgi:hypothetical protein